ncbi:hypothetical protein SAMN05443550_109207 [Pedobacter hartonius]|uniref:Uncharacterized protein n=1 Tax=Pedobacter hartonius TaxID=425514 RepID=A0A1H4GBU6_9SPHI|nr:hypothetical protein SAMN05443550_109207 [Pedobacter hartonius]
MSAEFIESISLGQNRYRQVLHENSSYLFRSTTPMHCYYGEIDEAIPKYIGILPEPIRK